MDASFEYVFEKFCFSTKTVLYILLIFRSPQTQAAQDPVAVQPTCPRSTRSSKTKQTVAAQPKQPSSTRTKTAPQSTLSGAKAARGRPKKNSLALEK